MALAAQAPWRSVSAASTAVYAAAFSTTSYDEKSKRATESGSARSSSERGGAWAAGNARRSAVPTCPEPPTTSTGAAAIGVTSARAGLSRSFCDSWTDGSSSGIGQSIASVGSARLTSV